MRDRAKRAAAERLKVASSVGKPAVKRLQPIKVDDRLREAVAETGSKALRAARALEDAGLPRRQEVDAVYNSSRRHHHHRSLLFALDYLAETIGEWLEIEDK